MTMSAFDRMRQERIAKNAAVLRGLGYDPPPPTSKATKKKKDARQDKYAVAAIEQHEAGEVQRITEQLAALEIDDSLPENDKRKHKKTLAAQLAQRRFSGAAALFQIADADIDAFQLRADLTELVFHRDPVSQLGLQVGAQLR